MSRAKTPACLLTMMLLALVALPLVAYANEPAAEHLEEKYYDITRVLSPRHDFTLVALNANNEKHPAADAAQQVIDLIVHTVQPNSWKSTGTGEGAIATVKNSRHVLVVQQTKVVHQEIADLLEQLTRLSDLQILYKVQEVSFSSEDWQAFVKKHHYQREQPIVDADTVKILLEQAKQKLSTQQSIVFNGEATSLDIRPFETEGKTHVLQTTGICAARLQFIRLTWSFDKLTEDSPACSVPLQKSVLIELPGEAGDNVPQALAVITPVILLRSNAHRSELTPVTEPLPLR